MPAPLERARALVDFGATLRRANRRAEARDIAQVLFITPKTVENHLGNAYRQLGVAGRGELPTRSPGSPPGHRRLAETA